VGVTHHSRQFGFQNAVQEIDDVISVQFGHDRYSVSIQQRRISQRRRQPGEIKLILVGVRARNRLSVGGRSPEYDGTADHADPHLILPGFKVICIAAAFHRNRAETNPSTARLSCPL
jgi:hypothetical protein